MSLVFANSLNPPAIASACSTVIGPCSGTAPGFVDLAHHVDDRRHRLDDDDGDDRIGDVFLERGRDRGRAARSASGRWPAMSPMSGSVILPSGRTCTDCESCGSL